MPNGESGRIARVPDILLGRHPRRLDGGQILPRSFELKPGFDEPPALTSLGRDGHAEAYWNGVGTQLERVLPAEQRFSFPVSQFPMHHGRQRRFRQRASGELELRPIRPIHQRGIGQATPGCGAGSP